MGHAAHFLTRLDRVSREQTELALDLYRDHEFVRFLLERAHIPPASERVALSLDDATNGPFVIVTREGRFVTCLGPGMQVSGTHVVPRSQLDALADKFESLRERMACAQRLATDRGGRTQDLVQRVYRAGPRLSREDFHAISAFQPVAQLVFLQSLAELTERVLESEQLVESIHPKEAKKNQELLRDQGINMWACAHLAVLVTMDGRERIEDLAEKFPGTRVLFQHAAIWGGLSPLMLRTGWAFGKMGRTFLKPLKDELRTTILKGHALSSALGLLAIGLRHSKHRAEICKLGDMERPPDKEMTYHFAYGATIKHLMEEAEQNTAIGTIMGQTLARDYGFAFPPDSPYQFKNLEDVPRDLALAILAGREGDWVTSSDEVMMCVISMVALAREPPEMLYLPRDYLACVRGPWNEDDSERLVKRARDAVGVQKPVQVEEKPGRNDPCSCGSGKKYKKCHGAA